MPQKKDSNFINRFRKIWNKIVQPKILFAKETYHLAFYTRKGNVEWKVSRSLWQGAILADVKAAFGHNWPGFTEIPLCEGYKYAIHLVKPQHLGYYVLYKTKFKGPLTEVQKEIK